MSYDVGLLVLRLVVGGVMFGHGAQKLFGWFGGYGLAGTSGFIGSQFRLRPAMFWTLLAGLSEAEGGLFLGGFYARSTTKGCDAEVSAHSQSYFDYSTGARCCRGAK